MSFQLSFTCGECFADSASLAALAILAGLLVAFGARVLAKCEQASDESEASTQPVTGYWSANDDHSDD